MNEVIKLTDKKFQEVYNNQEFCNQVANAHQCCDKHGNFKHFKTCSYPIEYIVSDEQIYIAKQQKKLNKTEALDSIGNKLVFVAMGGSYEPKYEGDPGNHRIRTEILNRNGHKFFIEVGTGRGEDMHVHHAIDRDLEEECEKDRRNDQPYNNYKNMERTSCIKYTKQNILDLVNRYFDCRFTEMVIDEYNLTTEDYVSQSPK